MSAQLANKINVLCQKIKNIHVRTNITENFIENVDSGFATIEASNFNDVQNIVLQPVLYTRIRNVVNFSFQFNGQIIGPNGGGGEFDVTLPIPSNFENMYDANGSVSTDDENTIGSIHALAGTNMIRLVIDTAANTPRTLGLPIAMVQYFIR